MSADTSYSKGVLYMKRDLFRSPLYTNNVSDPPPELPAEELETFMTVEAFVKEQLAPRMEITEKILTLPASPSATLANTRILTAVSEVCVVYPGAPHTYINASSLRSQTTPLAGKYLVHGLLAQGSEYEFTVPATMNNSFVGKKVGAPPRYSCWLLHDPLSEPGLHPYLVCFRALRCVWIGTQWVVCQGEWDYDRRSAALPAVTQQRLRFQRSTSARE